MGGRLLRHRLSHNERALLNLLQGMMFGYSPFRVSTIFGRQLLPSKFSRSRGMSLVGFSLPVGYLFFLRLPGPGLRSTGKPTVGGVRVDAARPASRESPVQRRPRPARRGRAAPPCWTVNAAPTKSCVTALTTCWGLRPAGRSPAATLGGGESRNDCRRRGFDPSRASRRDRECDGGRLESDGRLPAEESAPAALDGSVIAGRYTLCQEIGEGGMGNVYLAEQFRPVRREVALKLIKAGMDSTDRPRSIRVRAAGAGFDGAPEYRQGPRCRHDRDRAALFRDGTGEGRSPHGLLRPASARCGGTLDTLSPDLLGRAARPSEGNHSPRLEADKYLDREPRRRTGAQGDRLRPGQGDPRPGTDRAQPVQRLWRRGRHAIVYGTRAGIVSFAGCRHSRATFTPWA